MAELKQGTTIGGNVAWHAGNLDPTSLAFWTMNGNDLYPTSTLSIVGIGNDNPTVPLHVTGDTLIDGGGMLTLSHSSATSLSLLRLEATVTAGSTWIEIDRVDVKRAIGIELSTSDVIDWYIGMPYLGGSDSSDFIIGTHSNSSTTQEHMKFVATGGILVNTIFKIEESSVAATHQAGYGQIWVKNDSPNILNFTDDTGVTIQLGGPTTITDNANNRVITGSATPSTLVAETELTFDGTHLGIGEAGVDNDYMKISEDYLWFTQKNDSATVSPYTILRKSRDATSFLADDDLIGQYLFFAEQTSTSAGMYGLADQAHSASAGAIRLEFHTIPINGTNASDRLAMTLNGNGDADIYGGLTTNNNDVVLKSTNVSGGMFKLDYSADHIGINSVDPLSGLDTNCDIGFGNVEITSSTSAYNEPKFIIRLGTINTASTLSLGSPSTYKRRTYIVLNHNGAITADWTISSGSGNIYYNGENTSSTTFTVSKTLRSSYLVWSDESLWHIELLHSIAKL